MRHVVALSIVMLATLALGCRDAEPRISSRGHILAGRPVPGITGRELATGRVHATTADLSALEDQIHRVGLGA